MDFVEHDYVARIDLIAKARGLHRAESYIEKIPKSFQNEQIYRTLLANCAIANDVTKAEQVFNKMKDLEFPISSFACDQLLRLYKRLGRKKIADVLLLVQKENVKPSLVTYKILIDAKAQSNDMNGVDQIIETMKAKGIEPDLRTKAVLAKYYVSGGLKKKAEVVMKEMEGENLHENRWACRALLPLYASLGKPDEVDRIWNFCSANPYYYESIAAIEAYGKLEKIPKAEAVFEETSEGKKLSAQLYSTLLEVYTNNKMLDKGKELVIQMGDRGGRIFESDFGCSREASLGIGRGRKSRLDTAKGSPNESEETPL